MERSKKPIMKLRTAIPRLKHAVSRNCFLNERSFLIGFLKGISAKKIFDMHHELKRRYWGRHFWAKGYCVSTIGLDEEQIRQYVRWQLHKDQNQDQIMLWNK